MDKYRKTLISGETQSHKSNKYKNLLFDSKREEIEHFSRILLGLIKEADSQEKGFSAFLGTIKRPQSHSNPKLDFRYCIDKFALYAYYDYPYDLSLYCSNVWNVCQGPNFTIDTNVINNDYNKIQECVEAVYDTLFDILLEYSLQRSYEKFSKMIENVKLGIYDLPYNYDDSTESSSYCCRLADEWFWFNTVNGDTIMRNHTEEIEKQNNIQGLRVIPVRDCDKLVIWDKFNDPSVEKNAREKWTKRKINQLNKQ